MRLGVLPLSTAVAEGAYHTFVIYDRRLVTIELFTGQLVLRDPKDLEHYHRLFEFFSARALWRDDARRLLETVASDFRERE